MKNVERVRAILVHTLDYALKRVRYLVSPLDNGTEIADKLKGPDGARIVARLVDDALLELGHVTVTEAEQPNSATARAVRKGTVRQSAAD